MKPIALTALILLSVQWTNWSSGRAHQSRRPPVATPPVQNISYDGLEFRQAFNAARGHVRLTLVFSPTCEGCLRAADDVAQILRTRPEADVRVFVLWSPARRGDSKFGALKAARRVRDPRVRHFWDAWKFAVRHYTPGLAFPEGKEAWDIFVFYPPDAEWAEFAPQPAGWLQDRGLDVGVRYDKAKLGAALDGLLQADEAFPHCKP